jgi:hypothetical protein
MTLDDASVVIGQRFGDLGRRRWGLLDSNSMMPNPKTMPVFAGSVGRDPTLGFIGFLL